MHKLLLLLLLTLPSYVFSQSNSLDSLQQLILKEANAKKKALLFNQIAEEYLKKAQPEKAITYAQLVVKQTTHSDTVQVKSLFLLGKAHTSMDNLKDAKKYLNEAKRMAKSIKTSMYLAEVYIVLSDVSYKENNYQKALLYLDSASLFIDGSTYKLKLLIQISQKRANLYAFLGNNEKTFYYTHISLGNTLKAKDTLSINGAYIKLCFLHQLESNYDSSYIYAEAGLQLIKNKNTVNRGDLYSVKAKLFTQIANYDSALLLYDLALQEYESKDVKPPRVATLLHLGEMYIAMKSFDLAKQSYEKALSLAQEMKNVYLQAHAYNYIGNLLIILKDYQKAQTYFQKAIDHFKIIANHREVVGTTTNLALIATQKGNHQKALEYYQYAYYFFEDAYNKSNMAMNISQCFVYMNKLDSTRAYLDIAYTLASSINARGLLVDIYFHQYHLDSTQNNHQKALVNYKKYTQLKDSIFTKEQQDKLNLINVMYGLSEKKQALAQTQEQVEVLGKEKEISILTRNILIGMVVLLVVFILISLINYQNVKKRNQVIYQQAISLKEKEEQVLKENLLQKKQEEKHLQQLLDIRNNELTKQAVFLIKTKEIIEDFIKELKQVRKKQLAIIPHELQQLEKKLKRKLNAQKDWENFQIAFNEAHPSFFKTLKEQHSELTSGDLKLAALIKLNFEVIEIASILNITYPSLINARFRLRKKLGLEDEKLDEFLRNVS